MACARRPGSSTKLASIESYATPASSAPLRRSTSQSCLMSCPALGTAGSASSSRSGRSASLESGGRFGGGAPPASSPTAATCPNGRYHERPGATASDNPTSSPRIASSDVVSVFSARSGARRHSATTAPRAAASSTISGSANSVGGAGDLATAGARSASGAGPPAPPASSAPNCSNLGISERNSSSVKSWLRRGRSGDRTRNISRSSVTGTSRRIVTSSRERRASSASRWIASRARLPGIRSAPARIASRSPNVFRSSSAVFSPTPFTPGTLSDVSPTSAR